MQALFVILAVVIPLTIGSVNDAFLPMMGIQPLRIALVATTITAGLITYAIARFRLMALTPQTTAMNILATISDMLVVMDSDGLVHYSNAAFSQSLGLDIRERTIHVGDFVKEADEFRRALTELRNTSTPFRNLHLSYRARDGRSIPVSVRISVIREKGEVLGYVVVARDISEEIALQQQLAEVAQRYTDDLKRFAVSVQQAQEDEHQRIARELHDDICQRLTALKLFIQALEAKSSRSLKVRRTLRSLLRETDSMILEVRRISSNLRPRALDDFGLVTSLQLLCREVEKTRRLKVLFETQGAVSQGITKHAEIALYRITQEALSNVLRHAQARKAVVQLQRTDSAVHLRIVDDGVGFDVDSIDIRRPGQQHLGLLSMRERAELLGGRFSVSSKQKGGTVISVALPVSAQ